MMDTLSDTKTKYPRVERGSFEQTVLLLQGGGALGSYQAGIYPTLAAENLHLDWVAGISIGSINSAIIAGNPPEKRVERLRQFWEAVSAQPPGVPYLPSVNIKDESIHRFVSIGMAASFPTRRCNGCSTTDHAATRWRSRLNSGAQRVSCREIWLE